MRGREYKRRDTGNHGRRLVLAGLLVASGQLARAETPVAMVPLPLTPLESEPSGVRSNPFCQPVVVAATSPRTPFMPAPVQVARTQMVTGLGKVEENTWRQTVVNNAGGVALTSGGEGLRSYLESPVTESPGGVRANPMATKWSVGAPPEPKVDIEGIRALTAATAKTSGVSFSLSDAELGSAEATDSSAEKTIELSIDDKPAMLADENIVAKPSTDANVSQVKPATRPAAPWRGTSVQRAPEGLPEPVNLRALEPEQFAAGHILQVPAYEPPQVDPAEQVVDLEPLEALPPAPDESRIVNGGRPSVAVGLPPVAIDRLASTSIIPGKPRVLMVDTYEPLVVTEVETPVDQSVQVVSVVVDEVSSQPMSAQVPKTMQSVLVANESPTPLTIAAPEDNVQTPVAATAGPNAALPSPTQLPLPIQTDAPVAEKVEETIVGLFSLKPTEVRAFKIDSPVSQVQSDNMAVCAVLKAASGQIQLIATGVGTTRLSVHTIGKDGTEKLDRYEVAVGDARTSTVDSPDSIAMTLTQTVHSAFPGSNVLVSAQAGRLIVTGSCPDEDSARRMLRMIRSACASPVIDKVKVR